VLEVALESSRDSDPLMSAEREVDVASDRLIGSVAEPLWKCILLSAGPAAAARVAVVDHAHGSSARKDDLWVSFSKLLWPEATLPPRVQEYSSARCLVADGNRLAAWRAWRPECVPGQCTWTWKSNYPQSQRFYCGRATLLAVDEAAGDLVAFVHAVSNFSDLRRASTSCIYRVRRPDWEDFGRGGAASRLTAHSQLPAPRCLPLRSTRREEKAVLRWPAAEFEPGFVYVFAFASSGWNGRSDYRLVPLVDLSSLPEGDDPVPTQAASDGAAGSADRPASPGLRALLTAAEAAPSRRFIPTDHVEGRELDAMTGREVAEALLEGFGGRVSLPPAWDD